MIVILTEVLTEVLILAEVLTDTYRNEVIGRQVEGLSDGDSHLIFGHLLFA